MQVLPTKFENFLKHCYFDILTCCTDLGYYQTFEVVQNNDEHLSIELGLDWNHFCESNTFQPGNIRFKFTRNYTQTLCYVYQL